MVLFDAKVRDLDRVDLAEVAYNEGVQLTFLGDVVLFFLRELFLHDFVDVFEDLLDPVACQG